MPTFTLDACSNECCPAALLLGHSLFLNHVAHLTVSGHMCLHTAFGRMLTWRLRKTKAGTDVDVALQVLSMPMSILLCGCAQRPSHISGSFGGA